MSRSNNSRLGSKHTRWVWREYLRKPYIDISRGKVLFGPQDKLKPKERRAHKTIRPEEME